MRKTILCLMAGFFMVFGVTAQNFVQVTSDSSILAANNPHQYVNTRLRVHPGVTLTIEAGVVFDLDYRSGIYLEDNTILNVIGTATDSIYFNVDTSNAPFPQAVIGGWGFEAEAVVNMQYVNADGMGYFFQGIETVNVNNSWFHDGVTFATDQNHYMMEMTLADCKFNNLEKGVIDVQKINALRCEFTNLELVYSGGWGTSNNISDCTFLNNEEGIAGGQFMTIQNNYFEGNGIAVAAGADDYYVNGNTFVGNDSAIINLGYADQYIGGNTLTNNGLGVSIKEDFSAGFIPGFFSGNELSGNTINAKIYTPDFLNLTNNCWGEVDSVSIAQTIIGNGSIVPDYSISPFNTDCIPGLVFPGDTDHDQACKMTDLFPIGIHFGKSGPVRNNASLNWMGQFATDWTDTLANGQNIKHADSDGDGSIGFSDTTAISLNFGKTHTNPRGGSGSGDDGTLFLGNIPENATPGDDISIPLFLGTLDSMIQDIYGISFEIPIDTNYIESATLDTDVSFLGNFGGDLIMISRWEDGLLYGGLVRTDQQEKSGHGAIASLRLKLKDVLPDSIELMLKPINITAIHVDESPLDIGSKSSDGTISFVSTGLNELLVMGVNVFPNPVQDQLTVESETQRLSSLNLMDVQGRVVWTQNLNGFSWRGNVPEVPAGIYFLKVKGEFGEGIAKVQIQ